MPTIQITDEMFDAARARAAADGFASVDDYIRDVVRDDLGDDHDGADAEPPFDAERFFTPERIAELDAAAADVAAGRVLTGVPFDAELARRRAAYLKATGL